MRKFYSLLIILLSIKSFAQTTDLNKQFSEILKGKKVKVGVSIYDFKNKKSYGINQTEHFPMQSVFKFHIALAVLDLVDKGKLSLSQEVYISKERMEPDWYSPLRTKYPNGNAKLTLAEILKPTVSESDNVGCEVLLDLIGGPKVVDDYLKKIGMKDVQVKHNETAMQASWGPQFENYSSPKSAIELLRVLHDKKILSAKSQDFINKLLLETSTGPNRLKGLFPAGTILAHKTGTSGTNKETGIMAAVNDIGIVTLPNGNQFAIAVFVSNSKEKIEINEKIIAEIAKATYDYLK
ncbi:class A beta-lactamase, subclass A2 [Lacihabitans sp. CCS-44]|uniref:class A beta-lactamase, subclass A2 n=1 Tax=Lacihabitans sp. CCS-44 TaxID=2487331 RepID=UPI0020CE0481|nr:class A beta-lactamase, subclass A2 [Lacihabitans sp. CCS-44]MCP9756727.1 class A beta-lactamase, subclass A2 [Lacihabitans sp. CCS-44]